MIAKMKRFLAENWFESVHGAFNSNNKHTCMDLDRSQKSWYIKLHCRNCSIYHSVSLTPCIHVEWKWECETTEDYHIKQEHSNKNNKDFRLFGLFPLHIRQTIRLLLLLLFFSSLSRSLSGSCQNHPNSFQHRNCRWKYIKNYVPLSHFNQLRLCLDTDVCTRTYYTLHYCIEQNKIAISHH